MRKVLFFVVSTVLVGSMLFAAEDDARYALVIGNAAYDGDAALANSANDASDVAEALASVGWKVTKLINGDRKAMNKSLASFRDALAGSRTPTALLFYAGHGVQIGGQNYLLPIKEQFETPDDIVNDAMSLQTIMNTFDDAKVLTNIVILDACRDNPFVKKNTRSLGGTRGLSVVTKSTNVEGSAVMFSTAPGDTAADGAGRNGVFTSALLKYIKTDLTLQQIATRVTKDVKTATGGKQSPYSSLSLSDDFYLVSASLRTAPPVGATGNSIVTAPVPAPIVVAPSASSGQEVRASLILQKSAIVTKRQSVLKQGGGGGLLSLAGWGAALLGSGLGGYAIFSVGQAKATYESANAQAGNLWTPTLQATMDGAMASAQMMNTLFLVGSGVAGAGLLGIVASLFLGPDTSDLDRQIDELDRAIGQLGGS